MKLNLSSKSTGFAEPVRFIEPLRLDEKPDQETVFRKLRIWKSVLRKSRKTLSAILAAVFLASMAQSGLAGAALPPPTAADLKNPRLPTVAVSSTSTTSPTTTATTTSTQPAQTTDFLMTGPLSPATPTTTQTATFSTTSPSLASAPLTRSTAPATSPGRSLYVSTKGSNTGDGSTANPYGTIAYGVSQLKAGDTLYIEAGTYEQPAGGAVFTSSGTATDHITVEGIGKVVIESQGTATYAGYTVAKNYNPAFDTGGQDYIDFKNLTVNNLRAPVKVSSGSSYVTLDGINADADHFGLWIDGADNVTASNMKITNCRNGVRTDSTTGVTPHDILLQNMDVSGSKDVYSGFDTKYRNGDGFILEYGNNITVRNVKSHDNWDSGFDIKATNVTLEGVESYSNYHQNAKIWGTGIVFKDSILRDARSLPGDPVAAEGWGVNNRGGSVTFIKTTFSNNFAGDIRTDNQIGTPTTVIENSIIARNISNGKLWEDTYGTITEKNNIWYNATTGSAGFTLNSTSKFTDPKFADWSGHNFRTKL